MSLIAFIFWMEQNTNRHYKNSPIRLLYILVSNWKKILKLAEGRTSFLRIVSNSSNLFIRMPDQIRKVISPLLSDIGDLKMRRMFVVYSSFLCWGIKPTSAQMAVMISPITIQSNNENSTETNNYYDRYFEIKFSTIKQSKLYEEVFGTIRIYPFKQSTPPCQKKKLFWRPLDMSKRGRHFLFCQSIIKESLTVAILFILI